VCDSRGQLIVACRGIAYGTWCYELNDYFMNVFCNSWKKIVNFRESIRFVFHSVQWSFIIHPRPRDVITCTRHPPMQHTREIGSASSAPFADFVEDLLYTSAWPLRVLTCGILLCCEATGAHGQRNDARLFLSSCLRLLVLMH